MDLGLLYVKEVIKLLALLAAVFSIYLLVNIHQTNVLLEDLGLPGLLSLPISYLLTGGLGVCSILALFRRMPFWILLIPLISLASISILIQYLGLAVDCGCLSPESIEYKTYRALPINLAVIISMVVSIFMVFVLSRIRKPIVV
ncbi:hypothetical protein [Pelagibaculum spongiae]|uniref:Methylamine utilization protein MauE n=1 Tax=Pelagibaculum spongiae TaxID=2080658 RepID=A0A2V1GZW2_9GAMM|nr:hypothetical protein [Pelagibaculum spongiae]PVZ72541.1 hypothetical protein DC094_05965 [Pelagibaculum spongiae]